MIGLTIYCGKCGKAIQSFPNPDTIESERNNISTYNSNFLCYECYENPKKNKNDIKEQRNIESEDDSSIITLLSKGKDDLTNNLEAQKEELKEQKKTLERIKKDIEEQEKKIFNLEQQKADENSSYFTEIEFNEKKSGTELLSSLFIIDPVGLKINGLHYIIIFYYSFVN